MSFNAKDMTQGGQIASMRRGLCPAPVTALPGC